MKIACKFLTETDNAVQVYCEDVGERVWFPLSQVEKMEKDSNGNGYITVTDWIARKRGFDVD